MRLLVAENSWVNFRGPKDDSAKLAKSVIESLNALPSAATNSRLMRSAWEENLLSEGWNKGLKVGRSSLSIGYVRGQVGLCIQMGNTSRVYADLLKLETTYRLGDINQAILAVPSDEYSGYLGTNYASFSRAEQDIIALEPTLSMPIVLVEILKPKGAK